VLQGARDTKATIPLGAEVLEQDRATTTPDNKEWRGAQLVKHDRAPAVRCTAIGPLKLLQAVDPLVGSRPGSLRCPYIRPRLPLAPSVTVYTCIVLVGGQQGRKFSRCAQHRGLLVLPCPETWLMDGGRGGRLGWSPRSQSAGCFTRDDFEHRRAGHQLAHSVTCRRACWLCSVAHLCLVVKRDDHHPPGSSSQPRHSAV
jgi:hypothetical protein